MNVDAQPPPGYLHQRRGVDVTLRISQVVSACTFCKSRKIKLMKCDAVVPACSGCTKFGRQATCSLASDAARHSHDYVAYLQSKLQRMRDSLIALDPGPSSGSSTEDGGSVGQTTETIQPVGRHASSTSYGSSGSSIAAFDFNSIDLPLPRQRQPQQKQHRQGLPPGQDRRISSTSRPDGQPMLHHTSSAIDTLIADIGALPKSVSSHHASATVGNGGPTLSTVLLAAASKLPLLNMQPQLRTDSGLYGCLPDQAAALRLAQHYIQQVYPRLPFFSLQGFWAQFHHVYSGRGAESTSLGMSQDSGYSYFTVLLVLAIATSSLSRSADSMISNQARRLFQAGLQFRESAILPNTIVGVQSLLFLIQFATLNPSVLDSWYLIGVGMRNCVDLGLHQDPQPLDTDAVSPSLLETRRRLWWSMYSFDRSMSIGCGRPTEIIDVLINVQLPSFCIESTATEVEVEGYVQRYSALQLQSEIYDALNLPLSVLPSHTSPKAIVSNLQTRLETWQEANRPERNSQTLTDSEWLMGKMLLFRPCRLLPQRSAHELGELWVSARGFTALYRQLVESNGIFYVQVACEKVYWTGLVILYSYWQLFVLETEAAVPKPGGLQPLDLWKATKDIAFILQTLSERWEDGKFLVTRFDSASARVIELLDRNSGGPEADSSSMPSEVALLSSYASLVSIWATSDDQHGGIANSEELQDLVAKMI
ncbi:fungal specific transcription factor domain-containing protein [Ophiostoma piceae UAMH 11346]|uniref:Fungal specific transcription factor domain-containing protein n=1 Tax=Ophiostoma piceae (strain UAMH 11346) TaxID=1262450 RepID=S3CPC1_OPHP1|nr:fungal specific transcription factor domain-containing protein [Ophiostoma piceae UAMH 11346]